MTQLIHLHLDANQIRDISPLVNLTLLEELRLNRNVITDITPLIGLTNLRELRLADNPIYDFSPLLEIDGVELDIEIDLSNLDELNAIVEISDPNLRQVIRETLQLPEGTPITQQGMLQLTRLKATNIGITDLTGLEYAINLDNLDLGGNQIRDIRPLAGLIALSRLSLWDNQVQDITPLANLTNLIFLQLSHNNIADVSPLANLINLQDLRMRGNLVTDFSPLQSLNLIEFQYDEVCDIQLLFPSVRERIENRNFPSVFQAWDDVVGLDHLTWEQRNVLHDLHWYPIFDYSIEWDVTLTEPYEGLATSLAGPLSRALEVRERRLNQNPNMIFLGGVANTAHFAVDQFPPGSDFWLRAANGQILTKRDGKLLIDFVKPEVRDLLVKRIIAFARCGLYDGLMLDEFANNGTGFSRRYLYPYTDEEIIQAYINIFQAVRSQVRDDFLILINANDTKPTRYAEFINGFLYGDRQRLSWWLLSPLPYETRRCPLLERKASQRATD